MKKLYTIFIAVLLLSLSTVSAYSIYEYRTPDNHLVYQNQWARLGCASNDCYDYNRIARYGHRSSFGYEHFVKDHYRYYTSYDRGYDNGYNKGYNYGYTDGQYAEQYKQWSRTRYLYNHPLNYNKNPSCYNNYGVSVC